MHSLRLGIAVMLVFGFAGCGSNGDPNADQTTVAADAKVMPDVIGQRLDVALSDIERAGIAEEPEVLGGGVLGIIDESNWLVCQQLPGAGEAVNAAPRLTVDRSCPDLPVDTTAPSTDATTSAPTQDTQASLPTATEPMTEETLTATNNAELAYILAASDPGDPAIAAFAAKYQGRTIEFDGNIAYMNNHDGYETRFDLLIYAGDFSTTSAIGPNFQFRDINIVSDLQLTGANSPDLIGAGQNLHIVARVEAYEPNSQLFILEPVSTSVR